MNLTFRKKTYFLSYSRPYVKSLYYIDLKYRSFSLRMTSGNKHLTKTIMCYVYFELGQSAIIQPILVYTYITKITIIIILSIHVEHCGIH